MEQPAIPPLNTDRGAGTANPPPSFVPYTAFPAVEQLLERYLGPQAKLLLPPAHRENFVRFLPWMALVVLPLHFVSVLLLLGITAIAALVGASSGVGMVLSAVTFVLDVLALPGLFRRTRKGWALFTYALLIGALANVISLSLLGMVMSTALLWIAFQVKYSYSG